MKHIMIDIETMSSGTNAAVISVGAVIFDPVSGQIGRKMEVRNTLKAQRDAKRFFDPETVEWWLRQGTDAQKKLLENPRFDSAKDMMTEVCAFITDDSTSQWDRCLWAKSPTFDLAILRSLCDDLELKWPGHYSREYCVRTMLLIAKANGWNDILEMKPTIAHGALSDAVHQAEQMMLVMKRLKK